MMSSDNLSRPASPYPDNDLRTARTQKRGPPSPRESRPGMDLNSAYFPPASTPTANSDRPMRQMAPSQNARPRLPALSSENRPGSSTILPPNSPNVKVIHDDGKSDLCDVESARSPDEVISKILRQTRYGDRDAKSYAFYVMDGVEPNYTRCRRLSPPELFSIARDQGNPERARIMLRKASHGEPEGVQLHAAANVARDQQQQQRANTYPSPASMVPTPSSSNAQKSWQKLNKYFGEPLPSSIYPMSPSFIERRNELGSSFSFDDEDDSATTVPQRPRPQRGDAVGESRPDSAYVFGDPSAFFPDVKKDEIEKSVRMAARRSARISRANSRLSTASRHSVASRLSVVSNFSVGSLGGEDVPAVPAIPDAFVNGQGPSPRTPRPFSVTRSSSHRMSSYRDSIASSTLDPVDEDSNGDNRKSYISFGDSAPGSSAVSVADPEQEGKSWVSDGGSSSPPTENGENSGSLNDLREAIAEDGEGPDDELDEFLTQDAWDNIKCIRGKLIGQGSFGSVYMALHTLTAELMAVKQVELPGSGGGATDGRKKNMIDALKREIALLRELKHPNIVSYIGSNSDEQNLYIFLEYVPGGSIAKMLVDYGPMQEEMVSNLVRQILTGLTYLHSKDIIHRDIKGANILVDTHGAVKISDFGISKKVQEQKAQLSDGPGARAGGRIANRVSLQGSVFWMAPEVVKQTANTRKADIWSLGCLIVEMLTGSHPHPNLSQMQAIFKIGASDPGPEIPAKASKDLQSLLKSTFKISYDERPEAADLLKMPFISQSAKRGGKT